MVSIKKIILLILTEIIKALDYLNSLSSLELSVYHHILTYQLSTSSKTDLIMNVKQ